MRISRLTMWMGYVIAALNGVPLLLYLWPR